MKEEPKEVEQEENPQEEVQTFNFDDFKKVKHNWVKRGIKVNCEGADHPYHSHFLVKR